MNIKTFPADETHRMNYAIATPVSPYINHPDRLPLIVYLHGAGERGENFEHIYRHALPMLIKKGHEYPAIILMPQCPRHLIWNNIVEEVKALIDSVAEEYKIMPDRIAITGSSMGGYGTWEMACTYANFFSAIAPVAGGGIIWRAKRLITTPVYAYHGDDDTVVPYTESERMVNEVTKQGGKAKLGKLKDCDHNDGIDAAYSNTHLMRHLLHARRTDFSTVAENCEEWF